MKFTYAFPAIQAMQAGQAFYTAAIPFRVRAKLVKPIPVGNREIPIGIDQKISPITFWQAVQAAMPDWTSDIPRVELRQQSVRAHSVKLCAIAKAGIILFARFPNSWERKLSKLKGIDWSRTNTKLWEGRAMFNGRMKKSAASIEQKANAIS